jgi:hypothetical protein
MNRCEDFGRHLSTFEIENVGDFPRFVSSRGIIFLSSLCFINDLSLEKQHVARETLVITQANKSLVHDKKGFKPSTCS